MITVLNNLTSNNLLTRDTAIINTGVFNTAYVTNFQKCIDFTALKNKYLNFNTTTGYYTAPFAGVYSISLVVNFGNITSRAALALFVNDVNTGEIFDIPSPQYSNLLSKIYISLNAGDTLLIARLSNLAGSPDSTTICIERIP